MKFKKYKTIYDLLKELEQDCKTADDLKWFKRLRTRTKKLDDELSKLPKKQLIERFKDDLIKLDNSIQEDIVFLKEVKAKLHEERKRKAS